MHSLSQQKSSRSASLFHDAPAENNKGASLTSRNFLLNAVTSNPKPYPVVSWYGGSTYTTESFGIGWLSIAIIAMLRHAAPLMCCSRMPTRRRNSIGEGCIGLAGLRRMLVAVGCQK